MTPLDAYSTAYDALADTPLAADDNLRRTVAERVVEVLMRLRKDRGLNYLRGMFATDRFNQALSVEREQYGADSSLLVGRTPLWRAYETTAGVVVAAFSRPKN